ncbi:MAG TPA: glycosyltransferase family 39 protein [Promineifilum sp.]|nr:glycosyltransferase family 39 protein [Promineifilum sp.]HRO90064.1 glycosyltransferase family 39 protein [Promineifilum sp.]HRQ14151.1 glycosyltransferase family 39 protein [Promineifilum sp.]
MKDKTAAAWFIVILLLIIAGQWIIGRAVIESPGGVSPWPAVFLLIAAAMGLQLATESRPDDPPQAEAAADPDEPGPDPGHPGPYVFHAVPPLPADRRGTIFILIFLLLGFVLWRIPAMARDANYWPVFLAWLAAVLLFLAAVRQPGEGGVSRPWLRNRRGLLLGIGALAALALLLRVWRIGDIPFTLSGDEASQGLDALKFSAGEWRNPFTTGWLGVPTMSFIYNSISLAWFGPTVTGLRLPWALVGAATVITTFLLVRQLFHTGLATLTAFLVAVYHYHIHFSRLGSNQIADPLFMSLALLFLYRGLDRGRRLDWALSGVITGLALYFYAGARLTPLVMIAVLGYLFLIGPRRFWADHRGGVAALALAAFITAAPMLQYAARFPDDFNARINQVGIIQNGWLENEVANGRPMTDALFDQFQRAALAFNSWPDRTVWYGLTEPLLDPLFGAIFLMGMIYGLAQLLNPKVGARLAPMVAWWWGGMILGGMLTESPPSSQRLITLSVPAMFFVAYVLWELVELARRARPGLPHRAALVVMAALFAFISLTTYFVDYTPRRLYGGANAELATTIAPQLNALKGDHSFFMVGPPFMYWGFATLPFLVPDATAQDIEQPLTDPRAEGFAPSGRGLVYIVHPARSAELGLLRTAFPNGEERAVLSGGVDGRVLGTLYIVPPGIH